MSNPRNQRLSKNSHAVNHWHLARSRSRRHPELGAVTRVLVQNLDCPTNSWSLALPVPVAAAHSVGNPERWDCAESPAGKRWSLGDADGARKDGSPSGPRRRGIGRHAVASAMWRHRSERLPPKHGVCHAACVRRSGRPKLRSLTAVVCAAHRVNSAPLGGDRHPSADQHADVTRLQR